jgi:alpha-tubulin suppressor-like RCC1 family protein
MSGAVNCWGENDAGELGNGTMQTSPSAVAVTGITDATALSAGGYHTCARRTDGTLWCWGSNSDGQLGNATATTMSLTPVQVMGDLAAGADDVAAGWNHTCALRAGAVWCWGANESGQLGNGATTTQPTMAPTPVPGLTDAIAISAAYSHTCALSRSRGVLCWGANGEGQLGDGTTTDRPQPTPVVGLPGAVAQISTGGSTSSTDHTCVRMIAGGVFCWGSDASGELGDGATTMQSQPVRVADF